MLNIYIIRLGGVIRAYSRFIIPKLRSKRAEKGYFSKPNHRLSYIGLKETMYGIVAFCPANKLPAQNIRSTG
ncbi:hypothetical protein NEIELOOT_00395 [Neisseria elongata subsp. glycolytica ATCC 29315]|uniref:Uncharacterized protein n=1 Tax=Neisseria elongata subsp. glycolytica ATCC 29315 TaxID=546263 RepID=D4DMX1_NEIEG|nr:hypothetical protein NEIELOOT_00395 [Neisseria elongata subsp. glycolytica ATCC 29315]